MKTNNLNSLIRRNKRLFPLLLYKMLNLNLAKNKYYLPFLICFFALTNAGLNAQSCTADGGTISTDDPTTICVDGTPDPIDVTVMDASGSNSAWVITDESLNILALPPSPPFDLDGAGAGTCLIWYLRYEDGLMGAAVGENAGNLDGCFGLSNPITVVRNAPDGGTISTDDPTTICVDGTPNPIDVTVMDAAGSNSAWVITDESLNILALPPSPPFDLDGAGAGTCLIWYLRYEDGLMGAAIGENAGNLDGCFGLSNPITVVRNAPDGGTISTDDPTTICVDGTPNPIDVTVMDAAGSNSAWVITDESLNILALPPSPPFDLDGAGAGTCLIWYLRYEDGLMGAAIGENAGNLDGCFGLSNPITVVRNAPDGGTISTDDPTTICVDGTPDPIDVTVMDAAGSNSAWVITDESLNILALPPSPPFDLDGAGAGTCLIWYLRYEDGLMGAAIGENAGNLDGCFDLSNPITVVRNAPDGGTISTDDPTTICVDGTPDPIDVTVMDAAGSNSAWVITDEALNILALPPSPPFDLDGAGAGTCLIWYLSFEDGLTGAAVGENAGNLAGCFDLSNPITVVRNAPDGGTISTDDPTTICVDGVGDPIDVTVMDATGSNSAWVITDESLNILALPPSPPFDLDGAGAGTCLIWYLSYEGGLTGAAVGENTGDLGGCFDLSNPITVVRNAPDGGSISIPPADGGSDPGETETNICVDGTPDPINVQTSGSTGSNFAWVITDEALNILALPPSPPFDLDGAGVGTCLIWYLAFEDGLTGAAVGENAANLGGCFDLSNPITVVRTCCDDDGNPSDCDADCETYTLDFAEHGVDWIHNSTWGSFTDGEQTFEIDIENNDHILANTYESDSGLTVGINPHDVHDEVVITYNLTEVASSVSFDIVDLDYKTGGSKQQEAVCVYGFLGNSNTPILPTITSLDGSVDIDGNCAEATTNSAVSGQDESILVEFDECIDQIVIVYGTGSNSPTHNPHYSKITIGSDGFMTEVCEDECVVEEVCEDYTLNFEEDGVNWHHYATWGSYDLGNETVDIDIHNPDHILRYTGEDDLGVKVGINPHDVHDKVVITYDLSEVSSHVVFDIVDLDYKTGGSRQQEAVCVYGLLGNDDTQILPTITSVEGSVAISGNCAEATANSSISGEDESILVEFTQCIDHIVIVYGTGSNSPTHNPSYSSITIGERIGFTAEFCPDPCEDEEGSQPRQDLTGADVSIFPNPANNASLVTVSIESETRGGAELLIIDALGRVVSQKPIELNGATTNYRFDTNGLSSGVYLVQVRTQEWRSKAQQMVILNR